MIVACQVKSRGSVTDPFNSGFHSCFRAKAQAVLLVSAGWCPNTSYLWLRPLSNLEQHLNILCSAVSLANMDSPVQPAATGMLSLHLEAEGGNVGKSLFLAEPSQSGQKSGDAASVSDEDANEKKKKNKKRRRAERAAAAAAKKEEQPATEDKQKKCTSYCGKRKALSDFNADQNSCKECVLHQKAFWRHAKSQGCEKDMKELEKKDPKLAADVQKEFAKERTQAAAQEKRIKFSIQAFRKTLESRSGQRSDELRKFMWEGEWMEESKKAKYGFLGKEEAEQKWKEWMSDPSVARDQKGPRGYTRIAVPHETLLSGFNEVATKKELTQEERLSRNATDATIAARARMVVTESAKAEEEAVGGMKLADIQKEAMQHGVDMAEMYAASVPDALEAVEKKRRLSGKMRGDKATEGDGDKEKQSEDESQASSKDSDDDGPTTTKPKVAKWFDAETKCRKAERTWLTSLEDLANSVQILLTQCTECLDDFRGKPETAARFTEEMSILEKRQKWVAAIIEPDDASLNRHKQEQQAEEKQAVADSQTTSQDVTALGRVGPCKDYQDLQTIATLKQMAAEFRTCTSAQQIKEINEKGASQKKPINTLLAAVKAAKTDLLAAEKRAQAQKKKEEERAAKEAAKAAKAGAASGNATEGEASRTGGKSHVTRKKQTAQSILLDNNSELWQDDTFRIPVLRQEELDPDLCNEPFIQSGINLPQEVSAAVTEFGKVFAGSALRVTDGRAQTPLDDQHTSLLINALTKEDRVPSLWSLEALSEAASARDTLLTIQKASRFGFAACSISSGRSELAMMPCFRILVTGNMMVAVLTPDCSEDPKKMLEDMTSGNADVLMKRARAKQLTVATLGPGDMLFLPPVCAVSQRVHAHDVLGIRVGAYSRKFQDRMKQATEDKADKPAVPTNIGAVLHSAMEEQAEPQYSEEMMLAAAEKIAAQRHAAQQGVPVPSVPKAGNPTESQKDSKDTSAAAPKQNGDKESSGQTPQQQEDSKEKAKAQDSERKHETSESPCEKGATTKQATSNLEKTGELEPHTAAAAAVATVPAAEPPADAPEPPTPATKKTMEDKKDNKNKPAAAPPKSVAAKAKAEPAPKRRKVEDAKSSAKDKGNKGQSGRK